MKGYVAKHNKTYNLPEIERLTPDGFTYMSDMWRNYRRHVVDIENAYFEKDKLIEDTIEEFIIELGDLEDNSEDDDNNDTDGQR